MSFQVPEGKRCVDHSLPPSMNKLACGSNNGAFAIGSPIPGRWLYCIASDGGGWEHVSVTAWRGRIGRATKGCTPNWPEMCHAKDTFWGDEDRVVQFHPPRSEHVNAHEHCLHLWRPTDLEIPHPPFIFVGPTTEDSDATPA